MILLGTEMFLEDYRPFQSLHVPLVVLDSYYDELPFTTVLINNARGAFLATNYLVSEGHRNIGYLQSARAISNFEERADGFFRALRQNEIKKNMSYVFRVTPVQGVAYREFSRILDTHPALPTGFFADNDIIALDCIRALKEHGYRIPDDVSVVGFDDIPSCQLLEPPMTTTCVPKSFLGAQAHASAAAAVRRPHPAAGKGGDIHRAGEALHRAASQLRPPQQMASLAKKSSSVCRASTWWYTRTGRTSPPARYRILPASTLGAGIML